MLTHAGLAWGSQIIPGAPSFQRTRAIISGTMSTRQGCAALAGSENVPAVAMLHQVGTESYLRLLRNAGFSGLDHTASYYGLGLTLGNAEVTLEQLIEAYAMFARGGVPVSRQPSTANRQPARRGLPSPR